MDDIIIRPAYEADVEAISHLWQELVAFHHTLGDGFPISTTDGYQLYARHIQGRLSDANAHILVAEDTQNDGRIVGYIFGIITDMLPEMFEQKTEAFLADIFVEEQYRTIRHRTRTGR